MLTSQVVAGDADKDINNSAKCDIYIIDRRNIWRQAMATALGTVWPEATFRTVDPDYVHKETEEAAAAILMGALGFAENIELQRDHTSFATAFPTIPTLLITDRIDASDVTAAIRAEADGYLTSDAALEVLIQTLRLLMIGGSAFPGITASGDPSATALTRSPRPAIASRQEESVISAGLFTPKEREVLSGLGEGKPNKIIAYELGICDTTVKVHMRHIMRKLGVTNRTHAALLASEMLTPVD